MVFYFLSETDIFLIPLLFALVALICELHTNNFNDVLTVFLRKSSVRSFENLSNHVVVVRRQHGYLAQHVRRERVRRGDLHQRSHQIHESPRRHGRKHHKR